MIDVRKEIQIQENEGILIYLNNAIFSESDRKEMKAHHEFEEMRASESHKGDDFFYAILFRSPSIRSFEKVIPRLQLSGTETILEMGGGFCWASAMIKRNYPNAYVVASDLIFSNLQHTKNYEKILGTHLDEKWALHCQDLPFTENKFDRIFTFEAFHHFGEKNDFSQALKEMVRVLKPKGKIMLLYEPSSPKYLYKFAYQLANTGAYSEEDVLILSKMKQLVNSLGCSFSAEFYPSYQERKFAQTVYYYALTKIGILQKFLPCTVNIVIEKN
jgi:ubiquinone/menaquinone biosynthesis C-methylase UbiE